MNDYEDRDSKRNALVSRLQAVREPKERPEAWAAACLRLSQYDAESIKIWSPSSARDAYLALTDTLIEYFERKDPREPWRN